MNVSASRPRHHAGRSRLLLVPSSAIPGCVSCGIWRAFLPGIGLLLLACSGRGPKTPEAALERLGAAVAERDAEALFDALDQETRWSWMTLQRSHREAFDVVLSNFPEGEDREKKLRRLEAGATAETPAELFAAKMGTQALNALASALPAKGAPDVKGDSASVPTARGPLLFNRIEGRWGYAGFRAEAEEQKRRAVADLELIKVSATDYERARARSAP